MRHYFHKIFGIQSKLITECWYNFSGRKNGKGIRVLAMFQTLPLNARRDGRGGLYDPPPPPPPPGPVVPSIGSTSAAFASAQWQRSCCAISRQRKRRGVAAAATWQRKKWLTAHHRNLNRFILSSTVTWKWHRLSSGRSWRLTRSSG